MGGVDLKTWQRWLMLRQAKAARQVWEKSKLKDGWNNLTETEAALVRWTQEE